AGRARMDASARCVVLGAAMRHRPRPVMAPAGTNRAGARPTGPNLRPLHRRIRHRRPRSREGAARVRTHRLALRKFRPERDRPAPVGAMMYRARGADVLNPTWHEEAARAPHIVNS